MTDSNIIKVAHYIPVSEELLADSARITEMFNRWMTATPKEHAEWARQAAANRQHERDQADPVQLTIDNLLAKLGWSPEYAEHVVQPYCDCGDSRDGWERCEHARDLGLEP